VSYPPVYPPVYPGGITDVSGATWPGILVEAGFLPAGPGVTGTALILNDATLGKLDTGTLDPATAWTAINGYIGDTPIVQSISVTRSSTRQQGPLVTYEAGTCTVTLANSDARFSPENLAGPYVSGGVTQVRPMVPVRVRVTYGAITYPLYSGYVRSWTPPTAQLGPDYDYTIAEAQDAMCVLEGVTIPATGSAQGTGELSGARIARILTAAGWYNAAQVLSDIDAGQSKLQGTTFGDTALSLLRLTADSEVGEIYVNGSGAVVFRDRYAPLADARSNTPQAVFGDNAGTIHPDVCTSPALNPNPGFAGNITGWGPFNGATIAYSTAYQYGPAAGVLSLHGDGVTASPQAVSAATPVTGTTQYTTFAVTYTPAAAQAQVNVNWFDSGMAYISTTTGPTVTSGTAWQVLSVTATSPGSAAFAEIIVQLTGTPAAGVFLHAGYSSIIAGPATAAATELAYEEIQRPDDDATMANDIQATIAGSSNLQEAKDTASITRFLFPRSYARPDLILQADPDAANWAQYVLAISKNDEARFDSLTIHADADPDNLFPQVLGRDIGDRIQVWRRPPGMTAIAKDCFISSITHEITVDSWMTTWGLRDASKYGSFLTLDNATLGQLDSNSLAF
jgi:hypothetical protein